MSSLAFEGSTLRAYEKLHAEDKRLHRTPCRILKELIRTDDPTTGTGKPEALKHNLGGLWSRRLSQKDRLIYRLSSVAAAVAEGDGGNPKRGSALGGQLQRFVISQAHKAPS